MEDNRRSFVKNLGVAAAGLFSMKASAVEEKEPSLVLTEEQQLFFNEYSNWADRFLPVVLKSQDDPQNPHNNKLLTELADEAEERMPKLKMHLKDRNFAEMYVRVSQKISDIVKC